MITKKASACNCSTKTKSSVISRPMATDTFSKDGRFKRIWFHSSDLFRNLDRFAFEALLWKGLSLLAFFKFPTRVSLLMVNDFYFFTNLGCFCFWDVLWKRLALACFFWNFLRKFPSYAQQFLFLCVAVLDTLAFQSYLGKAFRCLPFLDDLLCDFGLFCLQGISYVGEKMLSRLTLVFL